MLSLLYETVISLIPSTNSGIILWRLCDVRASLLSSQICCWYFSSSVRRWPWFFSRNFYFVFNFVQAISPVSVKLLNDLPFYIAQSCTCWSWNHWIGNLKVPWRTVFPSVVAWISAMMLLYGTWISGLSPWEHKSDHPGGIYSMLIPRTQFDNDDHLSSNSNNLLRL